MTKCLKEHMTMSTLFYLCGELSFAKLNGPYRGFGRHFGGQAKWLEILKSICMELRCQIS